MGPRRGHGLVRRPVARHGARSRGTRLFDGLCEPKAHGVCIQRTTRGLFPKRRPCLVRPKGDVHGRRPRRKSPPRSRAVPEPFGGRWRFKGGRQGTFGRCCGQAGQALWQDCRSCRGAGGARRAGASRRGSVGDDFTPTGHGQGRSKGGPRLDQRARARCRTRRLARIESCWVAPASGGVGPHLFVPNPARPVPAHRRRRRGARRVVGQRALDAARGRRRRSPQLRPPQLDVPQPGAAPRPGLLCRDQGRQVTRGRLRKGLGTQEHRHSTGFAAVGDWARARSGHQIRRGDPEERGEEATVKAARLRPLRRLGAAIHAAAGQRHVGEGRPRKSRPMDRLGPRVEKLRLRRRVRPPPRRIGGLAHRGQPGGACKIRPRVPRVETEAHGRGQRRSGWLCLGVGLCLGCVCERVYGVAAHRQQARIFALFKSCGDVVL
mmetsp:Transcript_8757/g.30128  ORF Transcript_8757/g.30128 Transcript_8757/m.30128 type:complete len:435 (-) Transcript_8757:1068-2372(-)